MTDSAKKSSPLRRILGKGRRVTRRALVGEPGALDQNQLEELWHWVNGIQQSINGLAPQIGDLQRRTDIHANETAEHVDLVVDQLWRRLEAADARIASQVQELHYSLGRKVADLETLAGRMRVENASILRLIGHEEKIIGDDDTTIQLPISRMTVFSEVERGSTALNLHKLKQYVQYFEGAGKPVIDLGCGKGDFLELLKEASVPAYGVDLDEDTIRQATERGFDARLEDLFKHLEALPDDELGGAFSSQVVEHLPPSTIATLYEELFRVVAPGGRVVIETPNPATFVTHVQSFWRDPTHIRPVPMPALDFAARSAGFVSEQTVWASPVADSDKLQPIELSPHDPLLAEFVARFNANVEKLDDILFGYQDYALVCIKP